MRDGTGAESSAVVRTNYMREPGENASWKGATNTRMFEDTIASRTDVPAGANFAHVYDANTRVATVSAVA